MQTIQQAVKLRRRILPGRRSARIKSSRPDLPASWIVRAVLLDALGVALAIRMTPGAMIGKPSMVSLASLHRWVRLPITIPAALARLNQAGLINYHGAGTGYLVKPRWP